VRGLAFVALGAPAPQGSKRHVGRGVMVESSKGVKPWRAAVEAAARALISSLPSEFKPWDGPVRVGLVFTLARPQRPKFPDAPAVPPDLDKLARSTLDALTGVLWKDDSRVVTFDRLDKVYVGSGDPQDLGVPGCYITVRMYQ
jgi:Holliday junction resolvase RusA-like endonuclease